MSRSVPWRAACALVALLVLLPLAGCITPRTVLEADAERLPVEEFPPGTETVTLAVEPGVSLRGAWIPSDPGAPVVVHFLGSTVSIGFGTVGWGGLPVLWELHDLGFASLVLDYRGVGLSDGARSPYHLGEDARVVWEEALRRTDCDPSRIAVRGISIGTLATASLLENGAAPAVAVLHAPVRAETVAGHFVRDELGRFLGALITWMLRPSGDIDLVAAIAGTRVPILVLFGEEDDLLPPHERDSVVRAVRTSGGDTWLRPEASHVTAALGGHDLDEEERAFLARAFPDTPTSEPRLAPARRFFTDGVVPEDAARFLLRRRARPEWAVAVDRVGPIDPVVERLWLRWWRGFPQEFRTSIGSDALIALLDLSDPDGALDPRELLPSRLLVEKWERELGHSPTPEEIADAALAARAHEVARYRRGGEEFFDLVTADRASPELPDDAPLRLTLPPEDSLRQAVRLFLKCAGIPDRVRMGEGRPSLEVLDGDVWRPLALPSPPPAP